MIGESKQDSVFRAEVRQFLSSNLTAELAYSGDRMTSVYGAHEAQMKWQCILHAKGWAAPNWPVEYGGTGWTLRERHIFESERVRAGAPPISPMGIKMAGPAIIRFGSDQQRDYFLPRMLSGEHFWCQGYSEPEAGSDLAALRMSARRDGDDFVCSGSKIWVTHANVANWMFCLVRTATYDRKQQGITFLLIDMQTPGIEVRPITMASGEAIQNQIFFDDVRVPVSNVLGEIDEGWTVAKYLLEFERAGSAYAPALKASLDKLKEDLSQSDKGGTAALDHRLAEFAVEVEGLDALEMEILGKLVSGAPTGSDASMMKILGTELEQRFTEIQLDAAGPISRAWQPGVTAPGGEVLSYPIPISNYSSDAPWKAIAPLQYLNERAGTIYAGTNEIQRNIIAKTEFSL